MMMTTIDQAEVSFSEAAVPVADPVHGVADTAPAAVQEGGSKEIDN